MLSKICSSFVRIVALERDDVGWIEELCCCFVRSLVSFTWNYVTQMDIISSHNHSLNESFHRAPCKPDVRKEKLRAKVFLLHLIFFFL